MTSPKPLLHATCFFCGEAPRYVREVRLPHPDDPDWPASIGRSTPLPEHGIFLVAAACREHDDALVDAILDHFGGASGTYVGPPDEFGEDVDGQRYSVPIDDPAFRFARRILDGALGAPDDRAVLP